MFSLKVELEFEGEIGRKKGETNQNEGE